MGKPSWKAMMLHPVRKQEEQITEPYQQILRGYVSRMPNWTPEDVKGINMRYRNGEHVITYNNDRIMDIENGTPDTPLSPAIRSFMIDRNGK